MRAPRSPSSRRIARPPGNDGGLPNSEYVYRLLRDQIISGRFPPDTRLIEVNIAAEFGVSRTPVREALKRLAAEKLILAERARGMVVHAPDATEIGNVFAVRGALDGLAARLAAHRVTSTELARLRLVVDAMRGAVGAGDRDQIVTANQRFHDVIYSAAGNPLLARLAGDLRDSVRRFSTMSFASPERVEDVLAEHEAILAALEARDPQAAEQASDAHLASAHAFLVRLDLESRPESEAR